ncbi:hypothetical protein [Propionicicella superfundia]|uniref:hypothetical protein n=1 Tax=Propionicicella superfundia TaxID=348582 RepID=UPI00048F5932|nr:hypothetical protein [Propionicicella superfundia]
MSSRQPIARSAWIALAVGTVLVAIGVGLVIAGFADTTPAQQTMLDAASAVFALAVAVPVIQMTWESRVLLRAGRGVLLLYAVATLAVLSGVVLYVVGFATGPRTLLTTASTLTFGGLGLAFCFLAWQAIKKERPIARTVVVDDGTDDIPVPGADASTTTADVPDESRRL